MITLAFDSTAKVATVAVASDEKIIASYTVDNGFTQSELLLPMAEDMLRSLALDLSKVGLLACSVGPGSFTGVRIGAALVKGLAFGKNIPCCEVSSLEALAYNLLGTCQGIVASVMDARRGQVYTAIFRLTEDGIERLTEDSALSLEELCSLLREYGGDNIYLVGDGYDIAYSYCTSGGLKLAGTPLILRNQNAASVARAAVRLYKDGSFVDDVKLAPTYLRLPQAERERLEKASNQLINKIKHSI